MQANGMAALNKAVVYSSFAITGSGTPFNENFLTDTVLDTTNIWQTSQAAGPDGVLIVPAGSAYWLSWTLPDGSFSSEVAPGLTDPTGMDIAGRCQDPDERDKVAAHCCQRFACWE